MKHPEVSAYMQNLKRWKPEMSLLRDIALSSPLQEDYKWKSPCYTHESKNIILLGNFKEYCTMSFMRGALLSDPAGILLAPGPNSRSVRMAKFTEADQIREAHDTLQEYIDESIRLLETPTKKQKPNITKSNIPPELESAFEADADFRRAFEALTPGRQRGYLIHISAAKKSETRSARISRYYPRILDGYGMHDCVCGLSQSMPRCDGSHKSLRDSSGKR